MDWSIPYTFYPTTLSEAWVWALFGMAISAAALGTVVVARRRGKEKAAIFGLPILAASLFTTMILAMVVAFLVHDL